MWDFKIDDLNLQFNDVSMFRVIFTVKGWRCRGLYVCYNHTYFILIIIILDMYL